MRGWLCAGMYGGLRAKGTKADIALIVCDGDAVAAGVFTLNVMCAAPVLYCKEVLEKRETVRAVLVSARVVGARGGCVEGWGMPLQRHSAGQQLPCFEFLSQLLLRLDCVRP